MTLTMVTHLVRKYSAALPGRREIVGIGARMTYVTRTDDDDIQHPEAYR